MIGGALLDLTSQLHPTKPSTGGNKLICLVVSTRGVNLAIARGVLRANTKYLN
ncbi:hypothetical protein [Hymenobacter nivis]|uniref:hypothetical protein n=1 Tax=Hymenobacter nivis TaxID=1850093 RepID=UPI0013A54FA7|nr:hypothetical protein [Hymenobacter nivis]